jgi:cytochrome P450
MIASERPPAQCDAPKARLPGQPPALIVAQIERSLRFPERARSRVGASSANEEDPMSLALSPAAITDRFDPFSAEYLADPYPTLRELREAARAFYSPALDHWVVTRYADIQHVMKTTSSFSAVNALEPLTALCPHASSLLKEGGYAARPALTNLDPPAHTRQRRLANAAFTPKRIAELEPFIRDLAGRFLDERFRDGRADMIADLAWAFPALVLFRVLGLPESDLARVKRGARHRGTVIYGRASDDEQIEAAWELASFWRYAAALVEARTENPGNDFVSALVQAPDAGGDAVSRDEAVSIMLQMLFAGHETTTKLIGNSFRRLLEDRPSWDAIRHDPILIPNAIEEVLRFDGSVVAWRHRTKETVEIGDARLPEDAKVLLLLASGNRDPAVFAAPDRFDIRRLNAREHLSFGVGVHNCLGAPLARLEVRVVLEEVSRRLPSLRLAEKVKLDFPASVSMRGPASLPVVW